MKRFCLLLPLAGSALWMLSGAVLCSRTAGHPPVSFRHTANMMVYLGMGLFCIGFGLSYAFRLLFKTANRFFSLATAGLFFGSLSYAIGGLLRAILTNGAWEPLFPLGLLTVVVNLIILGVASLHSHLLSGPVSGLLLLSALLLLGFNDQYLPFMAIPFGMATAVLCIWLFSFTLRRPALS